MVADIHRNVTISTEIVFAQDYYFLSPMVQGGSPWYSIQYLVTFTLCYWYLVPFELFIILYEYSVGSNRMVRGTNFKICGSGHSNECVKSTCLRWCSIFEKMSEDPSRLNHFEDSIILPYGLVSKIFSMFAKQTFHSFFLVCISRPLQVYLRT